MTTPPMMSSKMRRMTESDMKSDFKRLGKKATHAHFDAERAAEMSQIQSIVSQSLRIQDNAMDDIEERLASPPMRMWNALIKYMTTHTKIEKLHENQLAAAGLIIPGSPIHHIYKNVLHSVLLYKSMILFMELAEFCDHFSATGAAFDQFFATDILADAMFIFDLFVGARITHSVYTGKYETEKAAIFTQYVTHPAFPLDVLCAIPFKTLKHFVSGVPTPLVYIPLTKLLSIFLRSGRDENEVQTRSGALFNLYRLGRELVIFCFLAHVFGCVLFAISEFHATQSDDLAYVSWGAARGISCDEFGHSTLWRRYSVSAYGALLMLIAEDAMPVTTQEHWFAFVAVGFGLLLQAVMIGQMALLISDLYRTSTRYQDKMDEVNEHLRDMRMPEDVCLRVREYFNFQWRLNKCLDRTDFLNDLSVNLRSELTLQMHGDMLRKVTFFQPMDPECLVCMVNRLKAALFLPGDLIIRENEKGNTIYFVRNGKVSIVRASIIGDLATLTSGEYFGEISLAMHVGVTASAIARTHCELLCLSHDDFHKILEDHPSSKEKVNVLLEMRVQQYKAKDEARQSGAKRMKMKKQASRPVRKGPVRKTWTPTLRKSQRIIAEDEDEEEDELQGQGARMI